MGSAPRRQQETSLAEPLNGAQRANLIHREIVRLTLLGAVAIVAFFVTRTIAASNREMSLRDAAEWYQRGEAQLASGDVGPAIDSFRRATVKHRWEKKYVLALARALARNRQDQAARGALLALRERAPEDPEVNLQLARLAAEQQDVTQALGYYHNTLYAPWSADQTDARRSVRLELVDFLLKNNQTSRAVSELLALSTDLPDDAPIHVQVAKRFLEAGDNGHALDQFQHALGTSPADGDALAGAGEAAFRLANYPLARRYLRRAPDTIDDVRATSEVVELVISNDPLASRLRSAERQRRLIAEFAYAKQRLSECMATLSNSRAPTDDERALGDQADSFEAQLRPPAIHETDTIESGVELICRLETAATKACPPASPHDRALLLIAHSHGVDQR
jgi:Flp pilus assembly protein TadD